MYIPWLCEITQLCDAIVLDPHTAALDVSTGRRHAHQSWMRVAPPSDYTSVITRADAAYDFLGGIAN